MTTRKTLADLETERTNQPATTLEFGVAEIVAGVADEVSNTLRTAAWLVVREVVRELDKVANGLRPPDKEPEKPQSSGRRGVPTGSGEGMVGTHSTADAIEDAA